MESMTDSRVILTPTGPLPEPVINGGMEEKVRAANTSHRQRDKRRMTLKSRHSVWKSALEQSQKWDLNTEVCEELSAPHGGNFPLQRRSLSFLAERRTTIVQPSSALNTL